MLSVQLKSKPHFKECQILGIFVSNKKIYVIFRHQSRRQKEFETLLTNIVDLVANISCGHLKLMLMISNSNDSFNSLSIHHIIVSRKT